jgi:hypothetical protein
LTKRKWGYPTLNHNANKNATQNKPNQVPKRSADEDHQGGSFLEQNGIKTK